VGLAIRKEDERRSREEEKRERASANPVGPFLFKTIRSGVGGKEGDSIAVDEGGKSSRQDLREEKEGRGAWNPLRGFFFGLEVKNQR